MNDLVVGALSAVVCGAGGLVMPLVVARLPEPDPDPAPEEGAELTSAQRERLEEGPKQPYDEMAADPRFVRAVAAWSAVAGALLGWTIGLDWLLLLVLPLAPVGTALAVIDLRTRLLPSRLVLTATAAVVVYGLVAWPLEGYSQPLVRGVIGLVVARSFFWVLWAVYRRGMGFGDVRLAALLGFVMAYLGWRVFAVGLYAPFLLFAVPGLLLALVHRDRSLLRKAYPFGPALLAGALLGVVLGPQVIGGLVN